MTSNINKNSDRAFFDFALCCGLGKEPFLVLELDVALLPVNSLAIGSSCPVGLCQDRIQTKALPYSKTQQRQITDKKTIFHHFPQDLSIACRPCSLIFCQ